MRKPPLIPVLLLTLFAIGWGAYWFVGAGATESALNRWFAERRAEGWVADVQSLEVHGFPNRFDTTYTGLKLYDPETGVGYAADLLRTYALSYRPTRIIAEVPGQLVYSDPFGNYTIEGETLHASATIRAKPALPVATSTIEVVDARVSAESGWVAALGRGQLSMRETPEASAAHSYDFAVTVADLDPGEAFRARVGQTGLTDLISTVDAAATIVFDAPFDRYVLERARPQPRRVRLDKLEAQWGPLALSANGALEVDPDGKPTGAIDLKARHWREMIAVARATGALSEDWEGTVTRALELAAGLKGDPETLEITLSFRSGRSYLGPIPVGPAPQMLIP